MKRRFAFLAGLGIAMQAYAATTINGVNRYACGANLGWMDWRTGTANGAVIGEYVCSGYIYAANVGWIHLGSGAPTNRIRYQNNSPSDYGVNHDGLGNLRGCAYGANIGWVNFESQGAPRIDLQTGKFTGSIYSANCGWITLSNSSACVQTDTIAPDAMDTNGLPIAWELLNFGHTAVDPMADPDGDGMSNLQECVAGSNPNDRASALAIVDLTVAAGGAATSVTWQSVPTRSYYIQKRADLNPSSPWLDSGLGLIAPDGPTTTRLIQDTNAPLRFYRVEAVRPLVR
jgi:hypothetical protein